MSGDPRELIRTIIGIKKAVNPDSWDEQDVISISVSGIDYNIPLYLAEDMDEDNEPSFPFIDFNLLDAYYEPHDIGATTRKIESYIDVGIWFTASDNYKPSVFGKALLTELLSKIRTSQDACSFGVERFVTVKKVRLIRDNTGRQVVYHYVAEIYAIIYD